MKKIPIFLSFVFVIFLLSILMIFFYAPMEEIMGVLQKIFYFHVSSAMNMLFAFSVCAVLSLIYLITRKEFFYEIAVSVAEVGVLLGGIVLISGAIWAKKAWGTFWTWEPRLTFTLILFLMFLGYLSLRSFIEEETFSKKLASGLAVLGLPVSFLIHISVEKWGGAHPQIVYKGEIYNPQMKITLLVSIISIFLLSFFLSFIRFKIERQKKRIDALFLKISKIESLKEAK